MSYEDALIYATAIVLLSAANAALLNHYIMGGYHIGMKVRIAVCSTIYRKVK